MELGDALIAATASVHQLKLWTQTRVLGGLDRGEPRSRLSQLGIGKGATMKAGPYTIICSSPSPGSGRGASFHRNGPFAAIADRNSSAIRVEAGSAGIKVQVAERKVRPVNFPCVVG